MRSCVHFTQVTYFATNGKRCGGKIYRHGVEERIAKGWGAAVSSLCLTLCGSMDCSHQTLSMGLPRQNTRVGCHFILQGYLTNPGIEPGSPASAGGFFTAEPPGNGAESAEPEVKKERESPGNAGWGVCRVSDIQWAPGWPAGDRISLRRAAEKIPRGILRPPIHRFGYQAGSLPSTLRLMPLKIFHRRSPKADENMRNASVNWWKKKKNHNLKVSWELCFIRQTFWGLKPKPLT